MDEKYNKLKSELKEKGFDILDVPEDVLESAITYSYEFCNKCNNHLIAFTDKDKSRCVDHWFHKE